MLGGGLEFPIACGSHGPIVYESDGTYSTWVDSGTWSLNGQVLTETMTDYDPEGIDWSPEDVGKPWVSTLQWADRNTFLKRSADGETWAFRRCPDRE